METLAALWESYWWMIFPLGGAAVAVAGKVGSSWERRAKRRHKEKLELLRVKTELKAASRGAVAAPPLPPPESQASQLAKLFATHDAVTARWLDYELDVAKLIAFPAMSDGRQPLTAAFLRAQRVADGLRPASPKARLTPDELAEYRNAVVDYEVAFDVAERDARRIKDSTFSEVERRRLDKAKQLLTIAIDQAATPAERRVAYKRVREELDGLISLSDDAIDVLETRVALELPTRSDTAPAESAPDPQPMPRTPPTRAPNLGRDSDGRL